MSVAEGLGEALEALRKRTGLSQRQVAKRASTTQSMVSRYERGASKPEFGTVEKLLRGMGYSLGDLDRALREVRGEPVNHDGDTAGFAPLEAEAIMRPQVQDEIFRQEVNRRAAEIVAAVIRELKWAPEGRQSNGS